MCNTFQASLEASEEKERRKKEDQRASDRQLLSGPTVHDAARSGDLHRIQELLEKFPEMKEWVKKAQCDGLDVTNWYKDN